jgi:fucokinase
VEVSLARSQNRSVFAEKVLSPHAGAWWDVVAVTAGSTAQAERYREEIERRRREGAIPAGSYVVLPDPENRRLGSGGATVHALASLARDWQASRVLLVHAGGESRRAPHYSTTGKLFGAIPVSTPWGDSSTVFDELMALSSTWLDNMPPGLVIASGDVVLSVESPELDLSRPGVTGLAIRQPAELAAQHGVYVSDEQGRVYTYLQKPSLSEVAVAGGLDSDGRVALDTGILRLDAAVTAELAELAEFRNLPQFDLYDHVTKALTGQWKPEPGSGVFWRQLAGALHEVPFWCAVVDGEFAHVGTTRAFRTAAADRKSVV